jgi:multidrug efflux system membrane fusion protein
VPVFTQLAERQRVPIAIHAIGTVTAISSVELRSRLDGVIQQVFFREGQEVKQGDPLFAVDPQPFVLRLQRAASDVARDEAQLRNAELEAKRYAQLFQRNVIAAQQYEQRVMALGVLRATLQSDRAALGNARLDLGYTRIDAPISGRTGSVQVTAGNLIKANADRPLTTIRELSPIYVVFTVPADRLDEVRIDARDRSLAVEVRASGDAMHSVCGELTFIDSSVDVATGTIALKATFKNEDHAFWPGQFVDATLLLRTVQSTLVSTQAVQNGQRGEQVFVVNPDLTVALRTVVLGPRLGDKVVIEQGLAPGERVVTDGQLNLVPGTKVRVRAGASTPTPDASVVEPTHLALDVPSSACAKADAAMDHAVAAFQDDLDRDGNAPSVASIPADAEPPPRAMDASPKDADRRGVAPRQRSVATARQLQAERLPLRSVSISEGIVSRPRGDQMTVAASIGETSGNSSGIARHGDRATVRKVARRFGLRLRRLAPKQRTIYEQAPH